tara:strand:+ start:6069 stop:9110 length:3042 start_codon:yes stop_codon:yes gene_type:complete
MQSDEGIFKFYFNLYSKYKSEYKENIVVLLQVGSFFEIYGIKIKEPESIHHNIICEDTSNILEVSNLCKLNISEKTRSFVDGDQIVMAGFRDYSLDKYLTILTESGYTVPVYVQFGSGKNITRELDNIYSPGTYLSYDVDKNDKISNNIMCIWMNIHTPLKKASVGVINKEILIYGLSVINIYTGESFIFQYETINNMIPSTFDELQRYMSIFEPNEIILITPFEKKELNKIIQYSDIQTRTIHYVSTEILINDEIKNSMNQKYIKTIIGKYFGEESYNINEEFSKHDVAVQSYVYLLHFIEKHSINLLKKISLPLFYNTSDRVILANHTLSQLNIIDNNHNDSTHYGKYSSVLTFLNNCCTPMGKRKMKFLITNPTFNEKWLNKEYNMIEYIIKENIEVNDIRRELKQIKDIDKICRQIVTKKIYPSTIYQLFTSITRIYNISNTHIQSEFCDYLHEDLNNNKLKDLYKDTIEYIQHFLLMENCKQVNTLTTFEEYIINKGVCEELDNCIIECENKKKDFETIKQYLNLVMQAKEKNNVEYVRVHETEKSGFTLQITSKRSVLLTQYLKEIELTNYNVYMDVDDDIIKIDRGLEITVNDIKYIKASSSNVDISFPLLNDTIKVILKLKTQIKELMIKTYFEILDKINDNILDKIELISKYSVKMDVIVNKVYIAKKYNYCKPLISNNVKKSFVDVKDIRHCLIEHLQENEIYVTNDISIGKENNHNGILLYGTNAVGKTSLIRSLGVSIIMAQSGCYVPASSFIYKPYTAIFSRILSNDNLFKGLSTFAVEMSELRVILKMSDENSMILGDELCSGTETQSAISIFLAGLTTLHNKESSFIFATHFHEIVDYDEINNLSKMILQHMEVSYDKKTNSLIYDRKLKEGSGPKSYGLEVCKSLYLEDEFIDLAYSYRNKYYPENRTTMMFNTTSYNAKKIRGICEICNENVGTEIHHLEHQQDANKEGYINSFHKNHKANLVSICEECHLKMHNSDNNTVVKRKKKTTKGYVLKK